MIFSNKGQAKMGVTAAVLGIYLVGCAAPSLVPEPTETTPSVATTENSGTENNGAENDQIGPLEENRITQTLPESEEQIKVAILLPLTGPVAETGHSLLNSATMALFDAYDPRIILLPLDTAGDEDQARAAALNAVGQGVDIILGPLLSENVKAAGSIARAAKIPLIGFSNDYTAAAPGQYVFGFLPENEVRRVVSYAVEAGRKSFAGLFPEGRYGDQVRAAYGAAVSLNRVNLSTIETYVSDTEAVFDPVRSLAEYDARRSAYQNEVRFLKSLNDDMTDEIAESLSDREVLGDLLFDTVMVPEGGALLRTLAPLLPFYEIDPEIVKIVGTGLWNDESLLNEPPLYGAWFAAPEPAEPNAFMKRYADNFGKSPPRIATLAYDAMSLISILTRAERAVGSEQAAIHIEHSYFSEDKLTDPNGFTGVDGLFRLLKDGTNERSLAILEISPGEFKILEEAPGAFSSFGIDVRRAALPDND